MRVRLKISQASYIFRRSLQATTLFAWCQTTPQPQYLRLKLGVGDFNVPTSLFTIPPIYSDGPKSDRMFPVAA